MKIQEQGTAELQPLAEKLRGQRTAMFTMREFSGELGSRPLTMLEMGRDSAMWAMVSQKSMGPHFAQAPGASDARLINLTFSDHGKSLYVSIYGRATLVDDQARKDELWTAMARPWFSGADDPDLTLLRIVPLKAEAWDGPNSTVLRLLAIAASVAAGKEIGLGEHEVFIPGSTTEMPMSV